MGRLILVGAFDNVLQLFGAFGPGERNATSFLAAVKVKRAVLGTLAMVLPPPEGRSREQS
jgi:hypothetical protein